MAYRAVEEKLQFVKITTQPEKLHPNERIVAVKPLDAHFRVVLYSLDVRDILNEVERLKDPDCVDSWSKNGSNAITRMIFSKTTENCASLAYRCLIAGGLYNQIESKLSLQPSSAVAPDDLLRIVVSTKVNESLLYTGEPDDWKVPGLNELSIDDLINAYDAVGQNVNPEDDRFPALLPSVMKCSIL